MSKNKFDVLCAGLATLDLSISHVDPKIMEKDGAMVDNIITGSGGDAVNASINMARLGIRTCLSACVGKDHFADIITEDLKAAGVDTSGICYNPEALTNCPVVLIEPSGERHILRLTKGGNRIFSSEHIPEQLLGESKHLHIASVNLLPCLDGEPLAQLFAKAHKMGLTTSMDATNDREGLWLERIKDVLPNCDIFIPSGREAIKYCNGETDILKMKEFFEQFGLKVFGVKLGEKGVFVTDYKHDVWMPSFYKGKPVDTTGAGDALCAGFVAGYIKGLDLASCAALGSAQAAAIISQIGANKGAVDYETAERIAIKNGYPLKKDNFRELGINDS